MSPTDNTRNSFLKRVRPALVFWCVGLFPLAVSCRTAEAVTPPPQAEVVLEAEAFRLLDAEVVADPAAYGGRAVRIMSTRSFCSADFFLEPGDYVARIRLKAPDASHDELYLTVGAMTVAVKPSRTGAYEYCPQQIEFTVTNAGTGFVQFATFPAGRPASEIGMLVDAVEIWKKQD